MFKMLFLQNKVKKQCILITDLKTMVKIEA